MTAAVCALFASRPRAPSPSPLPPLPLPVCHPRHRGSAWHTRALRRGTMRQVNLAGNHIMQAGSATLVGWSHVTQLNLHENRILKLGALGHMQAPLDPSPLPSSPSPPHATLGSLPCPSTHHCSLARGAACRGWRKHGSTTTSSTRCLTLARAAPPFAFSSCIEIASPPCCLSLPQRPAAAAAPPSPQLPFTATRLPGFPRACVHPFRALLPGASPAPDRRSCLLASCAVYPHSSGSRWPTTSSRFCKRRALPGPLG